MTQFTRLSAALALAFGLHASNAAAAGSTNVVETISLQLTFLTQGAYIPNSPHTNWITAKAASATVTTKDVIKWLGTATTNSFSTNAALYLVIHYTPITNAITYEVRYGTNHTNIVDVSQFFASTTSSEVVHAFTYDEVTKVMSGYDYENMHVVFTNAPGYNLMPYFHVSGFDKITFASATSGKTTLIGEQHSAPNLDGAGAGTNGVPALVTGSLKITGTAIEVR